MFIHQGYEITVEGKIVGNEDDWLVGWCVDSAISVFLRLSYVLDR
jgi:hypothetical protein